MGPSLEPFGHSSKAETVCHTIYLKMDNKSFIKYMDPVSKQLKAKMAAQLPSMFASMFDGGSGVGFHQAATFAMWSTKIHFGYKSYLLSFSALKPDKAYTTGSQYISWSSWFCYLA